MYQLNKWKVIEHFFTDLKNWLRSITGFSGVSLQPNAGAQGEYAGLMVIRKYHLERGEKIEMFV